MSYIDVKFKNDRGFVLDGRLEFPMTKSPEAFAVFAHAFTGSKNLKASRYISRSLKLNGIAVLRFDFTGLGESEGDFSETNFTTNVADIKSACRFLAENYEAPKVIIGHSLGGAASVYAAAEVESVKAVATVGTPSEPEHVTHLLHAKIEDIEKNGVAAVTIGGRDFTIKKQFLDDLRNMSMAGVIQGLNKAILIMHSPQDRIVEIENAAKIYRAAKHPKSFVTLNKADHMLLDKHDANYAGNVISTWVKRYIDMPDHKDLRTHRDVVATTGEDHPTTDVMAGKHGFIVDKSEITGGNDLGPSPYELLAASLGASTSMTIYAHAQKIGLPVKEVKVHLSYESKYEEDLLVEEQDIDFMNGLVREIEIMGELSDQDWMEVQKAANHCPIYLTLDNGIEIDTRWLVKES